MRDTLRGVSAPVCDFQDLKVKTLITCTSKSFTLRLKSFTYLKFLFFFFLKNTLNLQLFIVKKKKQMTQFSLVSGWCVWNLRTNIVNRSGLCPPVFAPSRSIMCLWVIRLGQLIVALDPKPAAGCEATMEEILFCFDF